MNSFADSFADDILAVERAFATLLAAKRDRSIEAAKGAAAEGGRCPQIIIEAADLLGQLGEDAAALDLLDGGLALDGPTAPLQSAYARHCRETGDLDGARHWMRGAMLRARPNAAMALALCEIELARGDDGAADRAAELAVQLRWIDGPGLRHAADRLNAIGRGDLAAVPLMMMHLRAKSDLALRSELAALMRAHAPFARLPEAVRQRLKLADPQTLRDIAPATPGETGYVFSNRWFEASAREEWDRLLPELKPGRILEIGSYEGASTCYLIAALAAEKPIEIHCIDSWEGGIEHGEGGTAQADMAAVERRFRANTARAMADAPHQVDLVIRKGYSHDQMAKLIAEGREGYFDFVYIDGSHQAPDVLFDAVLGFKLLRENGIIAFDDYLWHEPLPGGVDPIRSPKIAIDAFTNIYCRKLQIISARLYQLYARKLVD